MFKEIKVKVFDEKVFYSGRKLQIKVKYTYDNGNGGNIGIGYEDYMAEVIRVENSIEYSLLHVRNLDYQCCESIHIDSVESDWTKIEFLDEKPDCNKINCNSNEKGKCLDNRPNNKDSRNDCFWI